MVDRGKGSSWQRRVGELGRLEWLLLSRRSSACDALETATTAVISLIYKLQVRSPELIDEIFSSAEQLVESTRRFIAADVVLQRVLAGGLTSSDEQRREEIVSAINAQMETRSFAGRQPKV